MNSNKMPKGWKLTWVKGKWGQFPHSWKPRWMFRADPSPYPTFPPWIIAERTTLCSCGRETVKLSPLLSSPQERRKGLTQLIRAQHPLDHDLWKGRASEVGPTVHHFLFEHTPDMPLLLSSVSHRPMGLIPAAGWVTQLSSVPRRKSRRLCSA